MGAGKRWVRVALIAVLMCGAVASWTAEAGSLPVLQAPSAQITSGPPSDHGSRTAGFTFTSDDPTATFQCRLDGASYTDCTSPTTYSGLAQTSHLFEVRAVDLLGSAGPPAQWSFAVVGPETWITAHPSSGVPSRSATFSFTGSPGSLGFECSLDGAAFLSCTSPATYSDVSSGLHRFAVRAIGNDALVDLTPATYQWTNGPETRITEGPAGSVLSTTAAFSFTGTPTPVTFECSLDDAAFSPCSSPVTYEALGAGRHTFRVRAISDEGLVDASPDSWRWEVEESADLSTTVTATPDAVKPNGLLTYTVVVTNAGPSAAWLYPRLELPVGVTVESVTFPDGVCVTDVEIPYGQNIVGCGLDEALRPGSSTTLTVVARVDPGTRGPLTATASVEGATLDPDLGNNSASVTTRLRNR